ncbi:MAG: hypothetical protein HYY18_01470 [Planctomycetes bacterium]|nr:hypothetical protein [Planctomycetota bacterium]
MTYPNVLVMSYLRESGRLTPEVALKTEAAIAQGWQRILSFEVSGGGFDWYGKAPAKTILSAYGVMMLADMNRVYPIDTRVIDRAKRLLDSRQNRDGSWSLDVPMHTWRQLGRAELPLTAYVLWCLQSAGYADASVQRGLAWLESHQAEARDPYVKALTALALGSRFPVSSIEHDANVQGDAASWDTAGEGLCHARGNVAGIEATALSALALLRDARSPLIDKALTHITRTKDEAGTWHSTQATILCLKALLEAMKAPKAPDRPVKLTLRVNGKEIPGAFRALEKDTHDLVQQAEIPAVAGENTIELEADADIRATFQVAGRYYVDWDLAPPEPPSPVSIEVAYDKSDLVLGETLHATATLTYRGPDTFMLIADLGIPPGFDPDAALFEDMVRRGEIDKFALAGRQITLYFGRVQSGETRRIQYELTPRFPIVAKTAASGAYEYYTPQNGTVRAPLRVVVRERR